MRRLSLEQSVRQDDYGWVKSMLHDRGHTGSFTEEDGMESDPLRTALFTILLSGLAGLLIYFAYGVVMGEGRRVFLAMATLAALMACCAVAARRRILLRLAFALAAMCAFALLVDQFAYYHWHQRVDRLMTALQQGVGVTSTMEPDLMGPRPTSFRIEPGREVVLRFEPPVLAWTHRLDAASQVGHTLVRGWYRLLSKVTRGRELDGVAQTMVRPHQAYAVSVTSSEAGSQACLADDRERWAMSIDSWRGRRPL